MIVCNMICLWFDGIVLDVVIFYVWIFLDSVVIVVYYVFVDFLFGR